MIPDRQKLHVFYVAFSDNEINNEINKQQISMLQRPDNIN